MSAGANCLASSTTRVDSAFWGSHEEASFCWALFSLPASWPSTANTAIQKTRTTHLLQRPHGSPANRRAQLMTPPTPSHPTPPITIHRNPGLAKRIPDDSYISAPPHPPARLGPLARHRGHLRQGSATVARSTRFPASG